MAAVKVSRWVFSCETSVRRLLSFDAATAVVGLPRRLNPNKASPSAAHRLCFIPDLLCLGCRPYL